MKYALLTMLLLSLTISVNYTHNSLPDNDLWKYDNKEIGNQEQFNQIIDAGLELFKPLAAANNEKLVINKKWNDATVNANCSRSGGIVTINMYGGLARRPEIIPEGFALVLMHELNHAYGGEPYISVWRKMSAEGQADYMGTKEGLKKILSKIATSDLEPTEFMKNSCLKFIDENEQDLCIKGLLAGQSLGNLLAKIKNVSPPNYETPDTYITDETLTSYPKTVQCRLDTYFAGTLLNDRPLCWFKP